MAIKGCGTPLKGSLNTTQEQGGKTVYYETFATTFYEQFSVLLSRAWVNTRRNPVHTHAASGRSITMGAIVGLLFYAVGSNQRSVQDRTGALYFVLTSQIFSAQACLPPPHGADLLGGLAFCCPAHRCMGAYWCFGYLVFGFSVSLGLSFKARWPIAHSTIPGGSPAGGLLPRELELGN